MSKAQRQNIIDVYNMMWKLDKKQVELIKELVEKIIDVKLITVAPDGILDNDLDVTEKLMLLDYNLKSAEQREKESAEAIPLEEVIKELGLNIDDIKQSSKEE